MGPAAPILAAVGAVMGAKSVIEGLKEGNLFKAVLGGFSAYMGLNGLGAFGTDTLAGQAVAAEAAGAAAGEQAALAGMTPEFAGNQLASQVLADTGNMAMDAVIADSAMNAATSAASSLPEGIIGSSNLLSDAGNLFGSSSGLIGSAGNLANMSTTESFLRDTFGGDIGGMLYENGNKIMDVGGKLFQGYAQGEQEQAKMDFVEEQKNIDRQREDDSRARQGYNTPLPADMIAYLQQHGSNLFKRTATPLPVQPVLIKA